MPEIPDEDKNRRLHEYARKGLTGGVLMALQVGADVNQNHNENSWTALHRAAAYGHHALAQALLGTGADINAENSRGRTPLYCVIAPGTIARGRCSGSTAPSEGACRGARRTRRRLFITTNVK